MSDNKALLDAYRKYMLPVLEFRDIVITRSQGSYVWDADGQKILDLNSGQFCAVFGHSDPGVVAVMTTIAQTLQDTDTSTLSLDVLHAAKEIYEISGDLKGRALFLSTGAEAIECCLKYAKHIKEKSGIVAFDQGYHGLTHGSAGYSMSRSRLRPPLEDSFTVNVPRCFSEDQFSDSEINAYVDEFEQLLACRGHNIAAAIFEPIVSGGGFYFPPKKYFKHIRQLCDEYNIFLIFDECQTGFGRTGSWFYYQQLDCVPDFVVCAKSMGLGYPVSCVIANGNTILQDSFAMQHFSSHQNEPFAGALVLHAIRRMEMDNMLASNIEKGRYLLDRLRDLAEQYSLITHPRGKGLMCAFNLAGDESEDIRLTKTIGDSFCKEALSNGLLLQHCNNGKTIRLLPNYMVSHEEIDLLVDKLALTSSNFMLP